MQTVMGKVPMCVKAFFAVHGLKWEDVLVALTTDLAKDGSDCDGYVLLTKDTLYTAFGYVTLSRDDGLSVRRRRAEEFVSPAPEAYPLDELQDPRVELLISSGRAICEIGGETVQLFGFSSTYHHDASILCRAITELQQTGSVSERLLKEEGADCKFCPRCGRRFPDKGHRYCPHCLGKSGLAKRLAKLFFKYKAFVLLVLVTLLLNVGLSLLSLLIGNRVLYRDVLTEGGTLYGRIGLMVGMLIGVRLLSLGISLVTNVVNAKVAAELTRDLKTDIFRSIGRLSLPFFTNRQTGTLMTQVNNDANTIYWFLIDGFPHLLSQAVLMLVLLVTMFTLNAELALYTFMTIPLFFLSFQTISRIFEKLHARAWSRRASFNSLISDVIGGIRVVKAFAREDRELDRFDRRSRSEAEATRELQTMGGSMYPFLEFLMKLGSYVVWLVGGLYVMDVRMDFATLMTFTACFGMISAPIEMLSDVTDWWSECQNALKRLFDIQDAKVDVAEAEHPLSPDLRGEVTFRNVCFSYVENRKVLTDISFHIPAGKTLGIVGQTGAGKSTLANLLTRLYDVDEGEVLLDGVNIKQLSFDCLHRSIAIVSQETYLFKGTILENIRYARPDASLDEVIGAAKAAHAHEFIIRLPDGYQTVIGQSEQQLSGGERQRVSIARALLKDPKILILDEATSAMDTQTERDIQRALSVLSQSRTTVIIAHRLSTLRDADSLIVISDGRLAESGTASELMANKGVYHKLYSLQAEAARNIGIGEEVPD